MSRVIQMALPRSKIGSNDRPKARPFIAMKPGVLPVAITLREGANTSHIPSRGTGIGNATVHKRTRYEDPTLAAREATAREQVHTVAPLCNKGAYQLITGDDIKTAGRKV